MRGFQAHHRHPAHAAASEEELRGWFTGRIPAEWFTAPPEVTADNDEILVTGALAEPQVAKGASEAEQRSARAARVSGFREETRDHRIRIAEEAERRFGRKVAWAARIGDSRELFTTLSVPMMTRLRMPERRVLDTLVDAGVARSRSEALAWCVRLVGENESTWIGRLREALVAVEQARGEGPQSGAS